VGYFDIRKDNSILVADGFVKDTYMLQKQAVLFGILLSLLLLVIAARYYPGGSQADNTSVGYDWKNNYLSNLFSPRAVNGADNPARPWAVAGVLFLCGSFALFFFRFSRKIPSRHAAGVIRYVGLLAVAAAFLAVTPLHDLMVEISGTAALVSMFYITVFLFKSRFFWCKLLAVLCMLLFYTTVFVYNARFHLEILPVLQKTLLLFISSWFVCLENLTTADDFKNSLQPKK